MSLVLPNQAEPPLVLALDVGTSSARGLLYDRLGRALEGLSARQEYQVRTSAEGAAELDADQLVESICSLMDGLLERGAEEVANHGGAALLALESLGLLTSLEDAPAAQGRVFELDPGRSACYGEGLERQKRLYTLLIEEGKGKL